jgi:hypothetical protein
MTAPFVMITTHRAKPERFSDLAALSGGYNDFVEEHEPHMRAHAAYVDEGEGVLALVQVHTDADSADNHFVVAGERIHQGLGLADTLAVEVYGEPGPVMRKVLDENAAAGVNVTIRPASLAGFLRS